MQTHYQSTIAPWLLPWQQALPCWTVSAGITARVIKEQVMKSLAPQLRLPQGCPSVLIVKRFFGSCILEAYLDVVASALPHRVESKPVFSSSELKSGGWKSLWSTSRLILPIYTWLILGLKISRKPSCLWAHLRGPEPCLRTWAMPKEAGRYFIFVKYHIFQLLLSCRQPLLVVLQSSPNAAEGCPPLGWSPILGNRAHPVGISFSINASSGEAAPVQAVEAKPTCPSVGESMTPTER